MRRFLVAGGAAAVAILASGLASAAPFEGVRQMLEQAQRGPQGAGRGPPAGPPAAQPGRGPAQQPGGRGDTAPPPPQAQGRGPLTQGPAQRPPQARPPAQRPPPLATVRQGAPPPGRAWDFGRYGPPQWQGGYQVRARDAGRSWYSIDRFRPNYYAPRRFNRVWFPPIGFYVTPWYAGDYLPRGWYDPTDYLDWVMYQLPFPPIGAEWVRVGGDAVLVDVWNGEVLSVYRDLFYW